jgi:type I restriction enzyme, S subunit
MSFPAYDDYKDSGIECLGEIPIGWTPKRLKHVSPFIAVGIVVNPSTYVTDDGLPFIYGGDIREGIIDCENSRRISPDSSDANAKTRLEAGDVLTVRVGAPGVTAVVPQECEGGNCASVMLVRKGKFDSRWLCYLMNTPVVRNQVEVVQYGAAQKQFNIEHAVNFWLPVPDEDEQKAISWFLDVETSKIDGLVSEQRRLIELLKEKRQAVISHAVTKGLNPNAPMKPSGIQWLGDVPQHWSVVPLKRVARVNTGVAKGKDHAGKKTINVPYLRVANVQDGYLDLETVTTIDILEHELDRYRLMAGDVLMNEGGDFDKLGRGHIWDGQIDPCITQNHVFAVRPTAMASRWLSRITSSDYAQFYFMTRSNQSTNLASISSTNLMKLPVILPPEDEQNEILDFIGNSTDRFDGLLAEAERAIELLQERRTALISAAVTGKIDVREFAYQETA